MAEKYFLLSEIEKDFDWLKSRGSEDIQFRELIERLENGVIPAADVAPVRHGRWEPGNPICPVCGENKFKDLDADVWADWQPKFCPNCGARMNKEDE